MDPQKSKPGTWREKLRAACTVEVAITALALVYIAVFHSIATEDRLLLNLYYIGLVASAYALVKRRALALMTLIVSVAAGTTLGNVYFAVEVKDYDPLLDPVRNLAAWIVLLFLCWRLGVEAFRFQNEERQHQMRLLMEDQAMKTRAAALTSTSHEVRTPLAAILAISETLLHDSTGPLTDIQREFLTDIDESAQHLMKLINDILDYAKAEAGMIQLSHEAVALPELVDQCVTMIEPRAKQAEVTVTAQIDPDVKEINADPLRLKQILINLLSNAVKYNEAEGLVTVRVRRDQDDFVISVRDTGRGIKPEDLEHLFDPYYQAAHSDQGIGTGLGLSIIKHLVDLHGGTVVADSVPGTGSVFTLRLPARGNARPTSPATQQDETWSALSEATGIEVEKLQELAV